jgi:hypothetical protein
MIPHWIKKSSCARLLWRHLIARFGRTIVPFIASHDVSERTAVMADPRTNGRTRRRCGAPAGYELGERPTRLGAMDAAILETERRSFAAVFDGCPSTGFSGRLGVLRQGKLGQRARRDSGPRQLDDSEARRQLLRTQRLWSGFLEAEAESHRRIDIGPIEEAIP